MNNLKVEKPKNISFTCKNCGVCCHMQPPDVDVAEQRRIESRGFRNFLSFPDELGTRWIRRKKDDSCWFLTKDNKCAIYDVRPAVCQLEPFTIVDFDYERGLIELGLNFPFALCCVGVSDKEGSLPKNVESAALTLVQKILVLTAKDMELPVKDVRVYAETRSRLLRRSVELADLRF